MNGKQNLNPAVTLFVLIAAIVVIVGLGVWWAFGLSRGSYYGGVRTVPRRPPAVAHVGAPTMSP
jgi:hypothetical protein